MKSRRILVIVILTVGVVGFFSSFMFYQHLIAVSPTTPIPAIDQIWQLNQHGYLFYVTYQQYVLFHALLYGGWGLAVTAAILNYRWKVVHNLTKDGWRLPS